MTLLMQCDLIHFSIHGYSKIFKNECNFQHAGLHHTLLKCSMNMVITYLFVATETTYMLGSESLHVREQLASS